MAALHPVPSPASIASKLCPRRHPNDPAGASCRVCHQPLDAAAELVEIPPAALARLLLEDGTAIDLTGDLLIGRSPGAAGETAAGTGAVDTLTVTGRQVSRIHLLVRVRGWELTVEDCDSTNGTFLSRKGVRGRRRVPNDRPAPLTIGDTVHFGSRQALVVDGARG